MDDSSGNEHSLDAVMAGETEREGVEKVLCSRCRATLDAVDRFCRHCGLPTSVRDGASLPWPAQGESSPDSPMHCRPVPRPQWSDSRAFVLVMLFGVLGPLALPMLWRCKGFSTTWKVTLTILTLGVIVFIVYAVWYVMHVALAPLMELQGFGARR